MQGFSEERAVAALLLLATAMYLIAVAPGFRHRRALRIAAIAVYAVAFVVAAGLSVLWLAGANIGR